MVRLRPLVLAFVALLPFASAPAHAAPAEVFTWQARTGMSRTFTLKGGTYGLYINAHLVETVYLHTRHSCVFGGVFEEISPKHEASRLGPGIPLTTAVPYNVGPKTVELPAGTYHLQIDAATDCTWRFTLVNPPDA